MISIIFVRTLLSPVSELIRQLSGTWSNHLALRIDDEVYEATFKGVRKYPYNKWKEKDWIFKKILRRRLTVETKVMLEENQKAALKAYLDELAKHRYKYDWLVFFFLGIVLILTERLKLRFLPDVKDRFICTELVAKAFNYIGLISNDELTDYYFLAPWEKKYLKEVEL